MKILITQFMMLVLFGATILVSCSEDEDGGGQPVIDNVRVTAKDSTIAGGEFNTTIAIQGTGLGGVQKVFFNNVEAILNPVYVTSTNIICTIPDIAPTEVNDKITVVTGDGKSATYDFSVVLPEPIVAAAYNEFALSGSTNAVLGNYFYLVSQVLVGDVEVQFETKSPTVVSFIMPEGDLTDKTVTVIAEGGTVTSSFKLHPTEGNMVNFDIPATGWGSDVCWGDAERIDPANSELEVISGRYTRIKQSNLPATGYQGDWVVSTCYFNFGLESGAAEDKTFKFEANVVSPWKAGQYLIMISIGGDLYRYEWKPWDTEANRAQGVKTTGWTTVHIPLEYFLLYKDDKYVTPPTTIPDASQITDLRVDFSNGGEDAEAIASHYVALDNFRIINK